MRIVAPLIITIAAFAAGIAFESAVTFVLVQHTLAFWLIDHESVDRVLTLAQFLLFAAVGAAATALLTRAISVRVAPPLSWPQRHFWQSIFFYAALAIVTVAYVRCLNYCEGLVFGSLNFFGLVALGSIVGNAWVVRRVSIAQQHSNDR